jgi:hypothetical protein
MEKSKLALLVGYIMYNLDGKLLVGKVCLLNYFQSVSQHKQAIISAHEASVSVQLNALATLFKVSKTERERRKYYK